MDTRLKLTAPEIILASVLFISIFVGLYLRYFTSSELFLTYVMEDGIVEYLSFFFLFLTSMMCLYRVNQYLKVKQSLWIATWIILAIMFFFAAGEEISWGQRIFGTQSGKFFLEHNKQAETNLHNIVVNGKSINKIIFSQLMFVVLVLYFLFMRLLFSKIAFVRALVRRFRIPLPKIVDIVIFISATILILAIREPKQSELHELSFAIIFFLIFLDPEITD